MVLILWLLLSLILISLAAFITQPRFVVKFFTARYYCDRCHAELVEIHKAKLAEEVDDMLTWNNRIK